MRSQLAHFGVARSEQSGLICPEPLVISIQRSWQAAKEVVYIMKDFVDAIESHTQSEDISYCGENLWSQTEAKK